MPTDWRQGDVLAPDDAVELGVIEPTQRDTHRAIIISHSCDIASAEDVEPKVELLIGVIVPEAGATSRNGHSIRTLHLGATGPTATEWLQYGIAHRQEVDKADLLRREPWLQHGYPGEQRAVLRRWLAQRYARSEFPNAFIDWLKQSGVGHRFEEIVKTHSACLVGIYFDFMTIRSTTTHSTPKHWASRWSTTLAMPSTMRTRVGPETSWKLCSIVAAKLRGAGAGSS